VWQPEGLLDCGCRGEGDCAGLAVSARCGRTLSGTLHELKAGCVGVLYRRFSAITIAHTYTQCDLTLAGANVSKGLLRR
jgi:hypothetical protein